MRILKRVALKNSYAYFSKGFPLFLVTNLMTKLFSQAVPLLKIINSDLNKNGHQTEK